MKILLFLATGFEETEVVTVWDILKRASLDIEVISIQNDKIVYGAHDIPLIADKLYDEVNVNEADAIILPGGMPGTINLKMDERLKQNIIDFAGNEEKTIAAICAAPSILGELNLLIDKKVTCYPGYESSLKGARISRKPVIRDGNLITSDGPGHTTLFALKIVEYLGNNTLSAQISNAFLS